MASWFKLAPDPSAPTSGMPFDILANALAERRKRQQELEDGQLKHDRQMEFGRLQMGLTPEQQALARAKEERERARAEQAAAAKSWDDNFRAQQGVIPKINEALKAGDIALAKSLAASAGITDFSELGGPQQTEPGTFDYESERFLDQMPLDGQRQLDPEQAAAEQAKADRKRVQFSLIGPSPDAPRTQTEMDIPDQSSIEQAMGVLNEYASGAQGPELAAIAKANIGLVNSRDLKPGDALKRVQDAALRLRGQDMSAENSRRAAARGSVDDERADKKLQLQEEKDAQAFGIKILQTLGYEKLLDKIRLYSDIGHGLTKNNPMSDAAAKGTWVKLAQGGTGVISDSDMEAFYKRAGSIGAQSQDQIESYLSGRMGEEKKQQMKEAVKQFALDTQEHIDGIRQQFRDGYESSPNLKAYLPQMEAMFFGRSKPAAPQSESSAPARAPRIIPQGSPAKAPAQPAPAAKVKLNPLDAAKEDRTIQQRLNRLGL